MWPFTKIRIVHQLNVSWRLRRGWSGALRGITDAEEDEEDDRETGQTGAHDTPLEQAFSNQERRKCLHTKVMA
jgi:hypothetical protein